MASALDWILGLKQLKMQRELADIEAQKYQQQQTFLESLPPEQKRMVMMGQLGLKPDDMFRQQLMAGMFGGGQPVEPDADALATVGEPGEPQSLPELMARQEMQQGITIPPLLKAAGVTPESVALAAAHGDWTKIGNVPDALAEQPPTRAGNEMWRRTKRGIIAREPVKETVQVPYKNPVTGAEEIRFVETSGGLPVGRGMSLPTQAPSVDPGAAAQQTLIQEASGLVDELEASLFQSDGSLNLGMLAMKAVPGSPGKANTVASKMNELFMTLSRTTGISPKTLQDTYGITVTTGPKSAKDKIGRLRKLINDTASRQGLSVGGGGRGGKKQETLDWEFTADGQMVPARGR